LENAFEQSESGAGSAHGRRSAAISSRALSLASVSASARTLR
jgi:hypothetical protein